MSLIKVALVIPSLDPNEKLVGVVEDAIKAGFSNVILVDDGSTENNKKYFLELRNAHSEVTLLTHPQNLGKGEALKTAFRYYRDHFKEAFDGVVTADGDGQHKTEDIVKCALAMQETQNVVFGCRDFSLPDVPARSRFGNRFTSLVFKLVCGMKLSDTQTGLRAFPNGQIDNMLSVIGSRFEYETNMILDIHRLDIPLQEVKIETVYEDNNGGSHFRPIRDSARIYSLIFKYIFSHNQAFKYAISSFSSFIIDISANYLLLELISKAFKTGFLLTNKVVVAVVLARLISSLFNFFTNRNFVFCEKQNPIGKSMMKYYALCIPQMLINAYFVEFLVWCLDVEEHVLVVFMNVVAQLVLFLVSYFIQKKWVFKKSK